MTDRTEVSPDSRKVSGGVIATIAGLAALIIFIAQNRSVVRFQFLFLDFSWPLWLYTIATAILGALIWFGLGVIRRHRRRKERRANRSSGY